MKDSCEACGSSRREFIRGMVTLTAVSLGSPILAQGETLALQLTTMLPLWSGEGECTYPVPTADGASIDRDNQIILVRFQSHLFAFSLSCPHQNTALRWSASDARFQCPKHHSKYQPDGVFISGRATRSMDRHAIRRDGDSVIVDLDKVFRDDKDHEGWLAATVAL